MNRRQDFQDKVNCLLDFVIQHSQAPDYIHSSVRWFSPGDSWRLNVTWGLDPLRTIPPYPYVLENSVIKLRRYLRPRFDVLDCSMDMRQNTLEMTVATL